VRGPAFRSFAVFLLRELGATDEQVDAIVRAL
jgi:hypothetical protein